MSHPRAASAVCGGKYPSRQQKMSLVHRKSTAHDWHLHFVQRVKTVRERLVAWRQSWDAPPYYPRVHWTHRRLDSKALCSPSSDVPFTKPSVALLNTPVLILLRILVKVKVLHLWKLRLYVSDGDKGHRDKRGHLERRHRLARDSMSIPPKCHPCTLNPCLALDLTVTLEFFKILTHIYW